MRVCAWKEGEGREKLHTENTSKKVKNNVFRGNESNYTSESCYKNNGISKGGGGEPKCPPLSLPPPPLKAALEDFIQLEVELGIF